MTLKGVYQPRINRIFIVLVSTAFLISCGSGDKSGSSQASTSSAVQVQLTNSASTAQKLFEALIPSAHAAVDSVTFCVKRIRFKRLDEPTTDPLNAPENIDFDLGEVNVDLLSKTPLGTIQVPAGTYRRIEIDLENRCGFSLRFGNDRGVFETNEALNFKFRGVFVADRSDEVVSLALNNLVDAMNLVDPIKPEDVKHQIRNNVQTSLGGF